MKFIPVITSLGGEHFEQYINLDHVCSISPDSDYDEFDNFCISYSLTILSLDNGSIVPVLSSYDDFMERLCNIAKKSLTMNVMEED